MLRLLPFITGKYVNSHKYCYSECHNCNKYVGKNHKCFMKKVKATAKSIVRNLVKIMIQLKTKIDDIHVKPSQRNTYSLTLKLPKTQAHIP